MFFKCGFAGDDEPRSVFPTVVTTSNKLSCHGTTTARDQQFQRFVGDEAEQNRELYNLNYPIQRGVVTDWDNMERVSIMRFLFIC